MSGNMAREGSSGAGGGVDAERLRKTLLSIGVDKEEADKLISSRALDRVVVPIYWKDGLVLHNNAISLVKVPEFLHSFEKEFPDGQVTWDPEYFELNPNDNSSDVAIRVVFNLQEGDQGEHFTPKPTPMEEDSYQEMLRRSAFKGQNPVQAQRVLRGA